MKLKIHYPFKPFYVSQPWGTPNPAYADHFNDPKFKLHNGIDAINLTKKTGWLVSCPVEGFHVAGVYFEANGGGNELWLESDEPVQMFDQTCYARIFLCHAEKVLVPVGYKPKVGELLMIADSTGFSTGPHTHMGLYRITANGAKVDVNEATGSFDPSLFFTNEYAVDKATAQTLLISGMRYFRYLCGL